MMASLPDEIAMGLFWHSQTTKHRLSLAAVPPPQRPANRRPDETQPRSSLGASVDFSASAPPGLHLAVGSYLHRLSFLAPWPDENRLHDGL